MRPLIERQAGRGVDFLKQNLGPGPWRWRLISQANDGQLVVEYQATEMSLIGKFAQPEQIRQSHKALTQLGQLPFQYLRVPRVVAWDQGLNLLLSEKLSGTSCRDMALTGQDERLDRIGSALRELHESTACLGDHKRFNDHLTELIKPEPAALARELPQYKHLIEDKLKLFKDAESSWNSPPSAPLHRDFHLRQLFAENAQVGVVDWDLSAMGDPAFDVAYFTTYLKTHYPETEANHAINLFLAGYGATSQLLERGLVYEQFNYLRRACRRFRLKDKGWSRSLDEMMVRLARAG